VWTDGSFRIRLLSGPFLFFTSTDGLFRCRVLRKRFTGGSPVFQSQAVGGQSFHFSVEQSHLESQMWFVAIALLVLICYGIHLLHI
jgi:hypothetical protein